MTGAEKKEDNVMAERGAERGHSGILKLALELGPLAIFFLVNARAEAWSLGRFLPLSDVAPDQVATIKQVMAGLSLVTIPLAPQEAEESADLA